MGKMMGVSGLSGSYMNSFMVYTVYHYEWPLQASECFVGCNLGNAQNMCICMCFSRSRSDKRSVSIYKVILDCMSRLTI